MEKEWMNAPLPPLSESIIASGLVSGDHSNHLNKIGQANPKIKSDTQKKKKTISSVDLANMSRSASKTKTTRPIKPIAPTSKDTMDIFQFAVSKSSRPFDGSNYLNTNPTTNIGVNYKPPPIEEFHIYSSRNQTLPPESSLRANNPVAGDSVKKTLREEVQKITQELDSNIASISNVDLTKLTSMEQAELKTKLLQFYNYAFNQVILQEKTACAERAILLRRLNKFYNQLVIDIPSLIENFQNYTNEYNEKYNTLAKKSQEMEKSLDKFKKDNARLREQIDSFKRQLQIVTDSSNQKDIQISSNTFDLDFTKGQLTQLQYKLKSKEDKLKKIKKSMQDIEEENQNQLVQIETLTRSINQYQQGEAGYIVMYHDEMNKNEELKKQIKELEEKIKQMANIDKKETEVQTDPIETNNDNNNASIPPGSSKSKKKKDLHDTLKKSDLTSSNKKLLTNAKPPNERSTSGHRSRSSTESSQSKTGKQKVLFEEKEVQTDPITVLEKGNSNEEEEIPPELTNHNTTVNSPQNEKEESTDNVGKIQTPPSEINNEYINPPGYNVDHSKIDNLPDLFEIIMPFLSQPYVASVEQELKIINSKSFANIAKNQKPIVWAIQLIHNFLTDPFVRSIENQTRISTESIFVDWISRRYKLQHLITQAMSDFSYVLLNHRNTSSYLEYFTDILMDKYTFPQLCFLSTLYSFSNEFTFPKITDLLQELSFDVEPQIHIECIQKIFGKSFTEDLAVKFAADFHCTKENPLVNYLDFLKSAVEFFGQKHNLLYAQSKNLLQLCGCYDNQVINYDVFVKFFGLLGSQHKFNTKDAWKKALSRYEDTNESMLRLSGILTVCAEKKEPLMEIFELPPLGNQVNRLRSLKSFISDLYFDLLMRYACLLPQIFGKLPTDIVQKLLGDYENVRQALLKVDVGHVVYLYRIVLNKMDRLLMKGRGFIPFNPQSTSEVISKLVEYIDKTEAVSFAMIE